MSLMGCSIVDPVQDERVCVAMAARSPWMSLDWSLSSRTGLGRTGLGRTGFRRTGLLPDRSQQLSSRTGHRRIGFNGSPPGLVAGSLLPEWSQTDLSQADWSPGLVSD